MPHIGPGSHVAIGALFKANFSQGEGTGVMTNPTGPAGGDLSGTYPNPQVASIANASQYVSLAQLGVVQTVTRAKTIAPSVDEDPLTVQTHSGTSDAANGLIVKNHSGVVTAYIRGDGALSASDAHLSNVICGDVTGGVLHGTDLDIGPGSGSFTDFCLFGSSGPGATSNPPIQVLPFSDNDPPAGSPGAFYTDTAGHVYAFGETNGWTMIAE